MADPVITPMMTYALASAAGGVVSASINAYLNAPPRPSFQPHNGQETLYDEENWARVLDAQEILCLVRPFISASQNLDIQKIKKAVTTQPQRQGGRTLDEPTVEAPPPPYADSVLPTDPEAYLTEQVYRIFRTTGRLVETLTVASSGPTGSSALAWNLNVAASTELGLEVLDLYHATTLTMRTAPTSSFLGLVHAAMNLYDVDLLAKVEALYSPIRFRAEGEQVNPPTYVLRLPAVKRYLELGQSEPDTSTTLLKPRTAIRLFGGMVGGLAFVAAYETYQFFTRPDVKVAGQAYITQAGACGTQISFLPIEGTGTAPNGRSEKGEEGAVHFGDQVHIVVASPKGSEGLKGSNSKDGLAKVRIVHSDARYRVQGQGRVVRVRDRIILKEESTGKLLSRKKVKEDDWEVGFGISDDNEWSVVLPM
jgi:hypothetical protein